MVATPRHVALLPTCRKVTTRALERKGVLQGDPRRWRCDETGSSIQSSPADWVFSVAVNHHAEATSILSAVMRRSTCKPTPQASLFSRHHLPLPWPGAELTQHKLCCSQRNPPVLTPTSLCPYISRVPFPIKVTRITHTPSQQRRGV